MPPECNLDEATVGLVICTAYMDGQPYKPCVLCQTGFRYRTVSHCLSLSCTIANTIIHEHGTRVSFLKIPKIIHSLHKYTRMAQV